MTYEYKTELQETADLDLRLKRRLGLWSHLCIHFGTLYCSLECPLSCAIPPECRWAGDCGLCPESVRSRCPCVQPEAALMHQAMLLEAA